MYTIRNNFARVRATERSTARRLPMKWNDLVPVTISTVYCTRGFYVCQKGAPRQTFTGLLPYHVDTGVPGWRWKGQSRTTLVLKVAPPVKLRGYHRGALLLRLYQLPFDSELRPPPMYALAFRSVPQSPPTINAIHTKPISAPLAPDLAQCLCHVCTSLGPRAPSRPIAIEQPHLMKYTDKIE